MDRVWTGCVLRAGILILNPSGRWLPCCRACFVSCRTSNKQEHRIYEVRKAMVTWYCPPTLSGKGFLQAAFSSYVLVARIQFETNITRSINRSQTALHRRRSFITLHPSKYIWSRFAYFVETAKMCVPLIPMIWLWKWTIHQLPPCMTHSVKSTPYRPLKS